MNRKVNRTNAAMNRAAHVGRERLDGYRELCQSSSTLPDG